MIKGITYQKLLERKQKVELMLENINMELNTLHQKLIDTENLERTAGIRKIRRHTKDRINQLQGRLLSKKRILNKILMNLSKY